MSIDWKPEAIEAALDAWQAEKSEAWIDDMRSALDAAVFEQRKVDNLAALNAAAMSPGVVQQIRAEALEGAASYLDSIQHTETAKLIRALKGETP